MNPRFILRSSFILICFSLVTNVLFSQVPDWKWQHPMPTGYQLNDVFFVGQTKGFAVGDGGVILKTTDAGITWQRQVAYYSSFQTPVGAHFNTITFVNDLVGWIGGDAGFLMKTTNGGETWGGNSTLQTSKIKELFFLDVQRGWALGGGEIFRTTNGGATWQEVFSESVNDLHFVNPLVGWSVSSFGEIKRTTNGGTSWQTQTSGVSAHLNSVYFLDAQRGWAVGDFGTFLRTTNGGANWINHTIVGSQMYYYSVLFLNETQGFCVNSNGSIYRSVNGGASWFYSGGSSVQLKSIHFTDGMVGCAVGAFGTTFVTTNGGASWQNRGAGNRVNSTLNSTCFIDSLRGWAVGAREAYLKTTNGGLTWSSSIFDGWGWVPKNYNSVCFMDAQNGWIACDNGDILRSTNGGNTWQSQTSGTTKNLTTIVFKSLQSGWAFGVEGNIRRTLNGGTSWQAQVSGTTNDLIGACFVTNQLGWTCGRNGTMLKTTNGGTQWVSQNVGTTASVNSVFFIDEQKGWACGDSGLVFTTVNGGSNWTKRTAPLLFPATNSLKSIRFTDSQTGWVCGRGIFYTNDGGLTWKLESSHGTASSYTSLAMFSRNIGWVAGSNGNLLTTKGNHPEGQFVSVAGRVFEKSPQSCNPDSGKAISSRILKLEPGPYYGMSNFFGNYLLTLPKPSGSVNYSLSAVKPVSNLTQTFVECPPNNVHFLSSDTLTDTLYGKHFGVRTSVCHQLEVQISSNMRRRCFKNLTTISYSNKGFTTAEDAFILVEFPRWIRPLSASRPHIVLNDSTWRFNLGAVSSITYGSFTLVDSVLCGSEEVLGLTQCTKASIFPLPDCPNPIGWTGAEVAVSGACKNGIVSFSIANIGSGNMADSVDFFAYMDSILIKKGKVKLSSGDSLQMNVSGGGATVTLLVNQVKFHPTLLFASVTVERCGMNDSTSITLNHFPIANSTGSKSHCLPIIGSYDPNDKQVFPIGLGPNRIVKPGSRLEYLIRFQNTGTDTAFTVFIIDTLDQNLDPESFELGSVSHPYTVTMQTTGKGSTFIRWQFNNINLPDSNTNELRSHGFVQFRISPKPALPLGSKVKNKASIYFDFNLPIVTNQTLTTFDTLEFTNPNLEDSIQVVGIRHRKQMHLESGLTVFPNPFSNVLHLESDIEEELSLHLFDLMGKELNSFQFRSKTEISLENLSNGVYYLKFPKVNKVIKLVKQ